MNIDNTSVRYWGEEGVLTGFGCIKSWTAFCYKLSPGCSSLFKHPHEPSQFFTLSPTVVYSFCLIPYSGKHELKTTCSAIPSNQSHPFLKFIYKFSNRDSNVLTSKALSTHAELLFPKVCRHLGSINLSCTLTTKLMTPFKACVFSFSTLLYRYLLPSNSVKKK